MSNKTFIPAFACHVGDWNYYICMMKYAEVARQVSFAYELNTENQELGALLQRGLSERAQDIKEYLLSSEHRFLGGLVVAAWGGEPNYTKMGIQDPEEILTGVDAEFGMLTFDGTQQYFVLDGQHRLKAIKDAIKVNPAVGQDDICVIIVPHFDDDEGRRRTRRLFSNINRNAKATGVAENIALDEDDGFAILTRRLIEEHDFLKREGVVRVRVGDSGEGRLKLAAANVPQSDARAFTTFSVLYEMLKRLGWDLSGKMREPARRPPDDVLDMSYDVLSKRIDDLLERCGGLRARMEAAASAREVRQPKANPGDGHPLMRPVVQKAVADAVASVVEQGRITWPEALDRLAKLDWRLAAPPFTAVWNEAKGTMLAANKDASSTLHDLLIVHLAPNTKQAIKDARRAYREHKGVQYPLTEEALAVNLVDAPDGAAGGGAAAKGAAPANEAVAPTT